MKNGHCSEGRAIGWQESRQMVDDPSESSEADDDTKRGGEVNDGWPGQGGEWVSVARDAGRGDAVFESPFRSLFLPLVGHLPCSVPLCILPLLPSQQNKMKTASS